MKYSCEGASYVRWYLPFGGSMLFLIVYSFSLFWRPATNIAAQGRTYSWLWCAGLRALLVALFSASTSRLEKTVAMLCSKV